MKHKFTLFCFLLFAVLTAGAQDVTGIWQGYFVQNTLGYYEDRYKFEIQIEQLKNNAINGVTYSYKTTVFYGKADLTGFFTAKTNVLTINETKLIEVKMQGQTDACLMTCYLEYHKTDDLETLTGTYTSRNAKDKSDCGSGKVYLEKSTTTDFYKEDFLVKRDNELQKKNEAATKTKRITPNKATAKTTVRHQPPAKNQPVKPATKVKPGAEDNLVNKPMEKITAAPSTVQLPKNNDEPVKAPKPNPRSLPLTDITRKRTNELVKTVYTSANELKIDFYDNGEIDGDTISVYDNNKLIVSKKGLTDKPISLTVKINQDDPVHEFVMVAENMGSIPPNTALMIINAAGKRYELFLTSTEQKNAKVIVEYKPDAK